MEPMSSWVWLGPVLIEETADDLRVQIAEEDS